MMRDLDRLLRVVVWGVALLMIAVGTHASAGARVFLLGGQSNMAGAGIYAELEEPYKEPPAGVRAWHKGEWRELGPGLSAGPERFGPEIAFGHAMRKAYPDDDIYMIKFAAGGTSLFHSWSIEGGPMYKRFIKAAKAAMKNLDDAGITYTIDGMLWMQGETDAQKGKGAEYKANLTAFIKRVREVFEVEDMPFVLGRIIKHFDTPEGDNALVRAAQESMAKDMKNVAWFDTDDYEKQNAGHYNAKGLVRMGNDFAKGLLEMTQTESEPDN